MASTWEMLVGGDAPVRAPGDNLKAMNDSFLCRPSRDGKVGMAEFNCIRDDLALGICIDKLEAGVGIHGWTNVEAILGTKFPGALGC